MRGDHELPATVSEERRRRAVARAHRRRTIRRRRIGALVGAVGVVVAGLVAVDYATSGTPRRTGFRPPPVSFRATKTTAAASPSSSSSSTSTSTTVPAYRPPPVAPMISPAQPGEGQWSAMDAWDPGPPSVMTTSFRPDPNNDYTEAYVAWIRTSTAEVALYPGYKGPGPSSLDRGPEEVPVSARGDLLATFNSGFYEQDSAGGFYTHHTLYFPMIDGLATVVAYSDGRADVVDWTGGSTPGPDVVMARQNLPLMVDGGAATAALDVSFKWGLTLHGVPAVWRTALGVDAHGNLIYVAASNQTAPSLAQIMIHVGAVRAMQLDINPEWPIFVTYAGAGAVGPALFVPNPNQIPNRFLYSSTKDFFAVYKRSAAAQGPPW